MVVKLSEVKQDDGSISEHLASLRFLSFSFFFSFWIFHLEREQSRALHHRRFFRGSWALESFVGCERGGEEEEGRGILCDLSVLFFSLSLSLPLGLSCFVLVFVFCGS